jgi:hypothetical protein
MTIALTSRASDTLLGIFDIQDKKKIPWKINKNAHICYRYVSSLQSKSESNFNS